MATNAKKSSKKVRAAKAVLKGVRKAGKSQKGAPKPSSDLIGWLLYTGK